MRPGNSCFPIWPPCKVTTTTCFADYARLDGHPWVCSLLSGNSEKCRWDHLELVGEGAFVLKNGGGLRQPNNVPLEMWGLKLGMLAVFWDNVCLKLTQIPVLIS